MHFNETDISLAIVQRYHQKLITHLNSDIIIVGSGPSGLIAALHLAQHQYKVTVVEKRLTPGDR
jgi:thiamine thiazole synthase